MLSEGKKPEALNEESGSPAAGQSGGALLLQHHMEDSAAMTLEKFKKRLKEGHFFIPKMYFNDSVVCDAAESIINGQMKVCGSLPAMPFTLNDLDWKAKFSAQSGSFQLYLQSLTTVGTLTRAYELSSKMEYLSFAESLIRSWHEYAADDNNGKQNQYLWVDHSVARRTEYLIYYGQVVNKAGYGTSEFYQLLYFLLEQHGRWLFEDQNYAAQHNHGVIHDEALLYVGTLLQNSKWVELAKQRIEQQEQWAFAEDHVHKENSPMYAFLVAKMFEVIGLFLQRYGDPLGNKLITDMKRNREYVNWAVKPNGIIVQIGDTQNYPDKTHGTPTQMSRKSKSIHRMYPVSGVYFFRSNTDEVVSDDTWKTFKSGYVRTTHKHADDGSFVLYSKGYEIFVDSGIYGSKKNDFRKYFRSALAHNNVVVDGESWITDETNMSKVGICGYSFFPQYDRIRAFNDAWPKVHMERVFCSADDLTVIRDTVSSEKTHKFTQLFHLGERITILEANDRDVLLQIGDSGYIAHLHQYGDPAALTVYSGNLDRPGYGLISRGTNHVDVIKTLAFDMRAREGKFITAITIESDNGSLRLFDHSEPAASLRYNEAEPGFDIGNLQIRFDKPEDDIGAGEDEAVFEESNGEADYHETRNKQAAGTAENPLTTRRETDVKRVEETNEDHFRRAVDHVEQQVIGDTLTIRLILEPSWKGKLQIAWYLNLAEEHKTLVKEPYGTDTMHSFCGLKPGKYQVKYFLRDKSHKASFGAKPITIEASQTDKDQEK